MLTCCVPWLQEDVVNKMAERLGKTPSQVLLRWGLQHGSSVIPKSGSEDHQKVVVVLQSTTVCTTCCKRDSSSIGMQAPPFLQHMHDGCTLASKLYLV